MPWMRKVKTEEIKDEHEETVKPEVTPRAAGRRQLQSGPTSMEGRRGHPQESTESAALVVSKDPSPGSNGAPSTAPWKKATEGLWKRKTQDRGDDEYDRSVHGALFCENCWSDECVCELPALRRGGKRGTKRKDRAVTLGNVGYYQPTPWK